MNTVFVDTSAWIAVALHRDARHAVASRTWTELERDATRLVVTDWVFAESVTFLRARVGYDAARALGESILASTVVEVVCPNPELVAAAWDLFLRYPMPRLSLTDCLSFAVMRARRVQAAFTFDAHFADAGFTVIPRSDG